MVVAIALLGQPCELQSPLRQEKRPMMFVSQASMHELESSSLWNLKLRPCALSTNSTSLCRDESIEDSGYLSCVLGFGRLGRFALVDGAAIDRDVLEGL
jgi:hypothetical protein